jgi:hypothetical protein
MSQSPLIFSGAIPKGAIDSKKVILNAVADVQAGFQHLRSGYFGLKNYDRFIGQMSNHGYGMSPRHGSIVFSISLDRNAREAIAERGHLPHDYQIAAFNHLAEMLILTPEPTEPDESTSPYEETPEGYRIIREGTDPNEVVQICMFRSQKDLVEGVFESRGFYLYPIPVEGDDLQTYCVAPIKETSND